MLFKEPFLVTPSVDGEGSGGASLETSVEGYHEGFEPQVHTVDSLNLKQEVVPQEPPPVTKQVEPESSSKSEPRGQETPSEQSQEFIISSTVSSALADETEGMSDTQPQQEHKVATPSVVGFLLCPPWNSIYISLGGQSCRDINRRTCLGRARKGIWRIAKVASRYRRHGCSSPRSNGMFILS